MNITKITPDEIILSDNVANEFRKIRKLEDKEDPNRRSDLYGPYEAVYLARTGKLPPDYFEENDPEPWGLLPDEARRNIMWQALSGCLDIQQSDWALIYIRLVIDKVLSDDEFAHELAKVNDQFLHSLDHRHHKHRHHKHDHVMKPQFGRHIDCAGCSATAALLLIDPEIRQKFEREIKNLNKLSEYERFELLKEQGLDIYLNTTIMDEQDGKIILPSG